MTTVTPDALSRRTDLVAWLNLVVAIVLLNGGNLLLDEIAKDAGISLALFLSPTFVVAIGCLGLAFVFYVRALGRLPLAVAYPVMVGTSMIVVAVAHYFMLQAPLGPVRLLGLAVLFAGVALISSAKRSD